MFERSKSQNSRSKCKKRRKFLNQLINVRVFRSHVCFLSGHSDEEQVKQTKTKTKFRLPSSWF